MIDINLPINDFKVLLGRVGGKVTGVSCNRGNIWIKLKGSAFLLIAVQFDEPPFHLKIVEEMCNYRNVAQKN